MSSRPLPDELAPTAPPPLPLDDAEALPAEELLRRAAAEFGDRLCLTCSWQKQSSVLCHMIAELGIELDVVELDTHLFFRETYETRDALVERYGLRLLRPPVLTVAEQHRREGPNLWERDPDACCHIRKVEPLIRALSPYDAWVSGIRREQSPSRAGTPKLQWSPRYGVWKLHPLADWDERRVWAYIHVNEIPYNPLHEVGYRSIGCIPCTRPTAPGEEERAGRWAGSDKLECGLHGTSPLRGEAPPKAANGEI
jgi:phosphoadenosine phosphosulfate reductase